MKTANIKSANNSEKGIALLFSLIMLSLLLVMALSFALDSMFEQKAAYNSASTSSAALIAKAQLNQVISLVQNYEVDFDSTNKPYSHDFYGSTDADLLKERFENDVDTAASWFSDVNWNYIKSNDTKQRIIGRTAFIIIPDNKLPLDSLISKLIMKVLTLSPE